MKVHWLLERDMFDESYRSCFDVPNNKRMKHEIERQGMDWKEVVYEPLSYDEIGFEGAFDPVDDCVIGWGSLSMMMKVRQQRRWSVWCDPDSFKCSTYYAYLGHLLLNTPYIMVPVSGLRWMKSWIFETLGEDGCVFIRPDTGMKSFTGQIVTEENWDRDMELVTWYDKSPEQLVLVSAPRVISEEWRVVVSLERGPITGSRYKKDGELDVSVEWRIPEVIGIALEVATVCKQFMQDPMFVVDVAATQARFNLTSRKFHLLEINSFSCSGLYACEMEPIIAEAARLAKQEFETYHGA